MAVDASTDGNSPTPSGASYTPGPSDPVSVFPQRSGQRLPGLDEQSPAAAGATLQAPARAAGARPGELPAAAPPATTPAVPDQIVSAVVPLHGRGGGRHEVTLELRPKELGAIRVEVIVEQRTVHLTLHAADPATGRLLSAALPDLRSALTEAGLTTGFVGVGPDSGSGTGAGRPHASDESTERPAGTAHRAGEPDDHAAVRAIRRTTTGRLDLFL